ncbi:tetraspanin tsp3 [Apiospora kogelbergensis]|uniref:tetraspanin tsp3 n=1 Tax=Apiospora kogelbergensis TaxID=1337665 RepID=UPI00312F16EE
MEQQPSYLCRVFSIPPELIGYPFLGLFHLTPTFFTFAHVSKMAVFVFISMFLLALAAIAVYALVESIRLSLPVSMGLAILSVLLPFTAWASVFGARVFRRLSSSYWKSDGGGFGGLMQHPLVPFVVQVIQGLASVVVATLWSQGFMGSGQTVDCSLQTTWRQLWMAHDGRSIESIQNAFGCCGLNSVRDMAWPSPHGNVGLCRELTHRETSCAVPWRGALRRISGFEFGVALGCAAIQFFYLVRTLLRIYREAAENMSRWNRSNNAGVLEQGPEASLVRRTTGEEGE